MNQPALSVKNHGELHPGSRPYPAKPKHPIQDHANTLVTVADIGTEVCPLQKSNYLYVTVEDSDGPAQINSANSAGCHRLLRDGSAVCVTDAQEVAELAGPLSVQGATDSRAPIEDHDGLAVEDLLLLDALPVRSSAATGKLATVAGLSVPGVRAGLARLELAGLALRTGPDQWRRGRR